MMRWGFLALLLSCSKGPAPSTPAQRAIAYLLSQQEDGIWKSKTYSVLGTGQALTPFVLYALSHARPEELAPHRERIDRALERLPMQGEEYPSYSLALSILALRRLRPGANVAPLEAELRKRRLTEDLGWSESDPEFGGWDHGLLLPRKPQCQRPDLSVTAFACEALGSDSKARRFVERCRAEDGGFFFTPHEESVHQNKAGPGTSYATATCDALRILGSDPRSKAWLDRHASLDGPFGLEKEWANALWFYYAFVLSKVRPSRELASAVAARQRADGSFSNSSGLMKEDDPILATSLALLSLCLSR